MWSKKNFFYILLLLIGCEMQPVPVISDTRDWIAFYRRGKEDNAKSDIWLVNIQTGQEIQVTNTARYYEESPVWLSDNRLIYTIEPQPESYTELNLVIADFSSGKQKLLDYWTWRTCPSNGKVGVDKEGNIFYIPVGGKTIQMLLPSTDKTKHSIKEIFSPEMAKDWGIVWLFSFSLNISPDGNEFLFSACDTQKYRIMHVEQKKRYFDIYYYNIHDSTLKRLTFGDANNYHASWIGGDSIVFSSNRDGNWELYLMNRHGKILKRLTLTDSTKEWQGATVSPDHSRICYAGYDLKTDEPKIWIMDLKTGKTKYLTKGGEPAWSPKFFPPP